MKSYQNKDRMEMEEMEISWFSLRLIDPLAWDRYPDKRDKAVKWNFHMKRTTIFVYSVH